MYNYFKKKTFSAEKETDAPLARETTKLTNYFLLEKSSARKTLGASIHVRIFLARLCENLRYFPTLRKKIRHGVPVFSR